MVQLFTDVAESVCILQKTNFSVKYVETDKLVFGIHYTHYTICMFVDLKRLNDISSCSHRNNKPIGDGPGAFMHLDLHDK